MIHVVVPASLGLMLNVSARGGDVTVIRSDSRSVQIEFRAQYFAPRPVVAGGLRYTLLDFQGGVQALRSASVGGPDLRYRNIPVAFPGERGNAVRVIAADYEDIPGMTVAPVPTIHRNDKKPPDVVYEADPARYGKEGFLPGPVAELAPVGKVRAMLLGGVRITPVQFNPVSRTVRKYTRVVVEVTFGPQSASLINRGDDPLLKNVPVNYAAARTWGSRGLGKAAAVVPSVLASGNWYRIPVTAEGIYRLDATYLSSLGIALSGIDPRTIRIYGNGGRELPEDITAARPVDLVEDAIYVAGESDGKFDAGDYVLFYGNGVRGWAYDPVGRTRRHYIHDYSEVNYYWLTYGAGAGKRMAGQPSLSPQSVLAEDTFVDGIANEDEKTNLLLTSPGGGEGSGRQWFGQQVNSGSSFTYVNALAGLVPTGSIIYRYAVAGESDNTAAFTLSEGGSPIGYAPLYSLGGYTVATEGQFQASGTSSLSGNRSQLTFAYSGTGASAAGWVDWFEILYPRALSAVNDSLRFYAPDTSAVVEYHLQSFSAMPMVFNVTDQANVRIVSGLGGSFLFRASETSGAPSSYWAVAGNSWRVPAAGTLMQNENIRGYTGGADFIIVTASQYRPGADRLAAYRTDPLHGGLKVYVADVNQIYDEFGGGVTDVTAIRDFLKYAYDNWTPAPRFVLMLGQASFDYKGLLGVQSSFVPTWETPESLDDLESWATDDFYGKFSGTDAPSLVIGRLSARTGAESDAFVDKLIRYENSSVADGWKMSMLFIGDDAWTPEEGEVGNMTIHSDAAEALAGPLFTPTEFEEEKVYLAEYPTAFTAAGRRKPGAYQAILDDINKGVLVVNFAGHGNPFQLSNNDVFDIPTSVPQLVNADRLSVFFLATCNFSEFDDPLIRTGSEVLINKPDGAAIGVVSADRKVYAGENAALNQGTYQAMFTRDAYGRVVVDRPAAALFAYKASGGNIDNDQKYSYMGDPTMRLQFPQGYASLDSINSRPLDSAGIPLPTVAQLRSLSRLTVAGTVRDAANRVDAAYNGRVEVTLNDASRIQTIVNFYPGADPWTYLATGGLLYRGENSVSGGKFTATFVVPKDIQYGDSLSRGRLVAYVYRTGGSDAEAYTGSVHIGGTDSTAVNPKTGPSVQVYLGSRSYRPGDLVGENPLLIVDLADSSGINTSTSGVGHRIEAWLNNASQSTDLTNYYTSKLDSYREGSIQYQLQNVPEGQNTIRVRAWNSFDNSGSAETAFQVASTDRLSVTDVFNYPNPFGASGTEFTFRQNQTSPLAVTVKIYTVAGRLIRTLDAYAPGDSFIRVAWDGRDRDGDVIANGVYLYKLVVRTADGRFSSEALSKLSKVQ
jgi:hypothetical protein